ncbi:MAG: PilZ domain-containing protein [Proteobacteria bacterium]|nr:PilZ domain-containing protein [Pseudomonadota bacterium]
MSAPFVPPHSPTGQSQTGRRADARVRLGPGLPCTLVTLRGTMMGRVEDVSRTGARIALAGTPPLGAEGVLTIQDVETFGEVVWHRAGRVGFRFDEKLPLESVVRLRHFADDYDGHEEQRRLRIAQEFVTGRRV